MPTKPTDSILSSTKILLGVDPEYKAFDLELVMLINSALFSLYQIGVGEDPYTVADESNTWTDFLGVDTRLDVVKALIYKKVRLTWDPPSVGFVLEAIKASIAEDEWRINIEAERSR